MKIKTILMSMLAVAALVSCDKEEGGVPAAPEMGNFEVVLPGAPSTMAVEAPQATGAVTPTYTDVAVYLVDGGGNYVKHEWTDTEIAAKSKRFEQIVKPAKVVVVANKGNVTLPATTTAAGLTTAMNALTIANQNKGVANVTLMGEQSTFTGVDGGDGDGHSLFKATVTLTSLVSRFEAGTVKAGTGLASISVEAVYVNYFYNTYEMAAAAAQQLTETTWPATFTPAWATDEASADVTSLDGTKCYAYQVFTGNMVPHIIYKVSGTVSEGYKLSDGTTGDFTGMYITVKGFKVGAKTLVGADVTPTDQLYAMQVNEIYKMGLADGGIVITPEQITDKPEKAKVDLIVEVTVAPWTEKTVTPEI